MGVGTTTLTRVTVGLGSAASVSTAVGVPVALHIQGKSENNNGYVQSHNSRITLASLSKCESSDQTSKIEVEFGDSKVSNICGTAENKGKELTSPDTYTTFFKEQGNNKNKDGNRNDNQNQGTQQCLDRENLTPGVIFDSSSTSTWVQHLGLCDNSNLDKTMFVKKRKGPTDERYGEKGVLLTCENDCGKTNPGTDNGKTLLTDDKKENGSEIKFFKQ